MPIGPVTEAKPLRLLITFDDKKSVDSIFMEIKRKRVFE